MDYPLPNYGGKVAFVVVQLLLAGGVWTIGISRWWLLVPLVFAALGIALIAQTYREQQHMDHVQRHGRMP